MSFNRSSGKSSSQQTVGQTKEERELNKLDLDLRRQLQPQLIDTNKLALGLSGNLLSGGDLPGSLAGLPGGISPEVTQQIVNDSLQDVRTNFNSVGILDSGVAQEIGARTAADIRTQSEQFNLQNLLQLLNIAVGSSAQAQAPAIGFGQQLSSRLQGLRSISQSANSSQNNFSYDSAEMMKGAGALVAALGGCWVASEVFGGWYHPKTVAARYYVNNIAPKWFRSFYLKHGEKIAEFIHDKPVLKAIIRPVFEVFAFIGKGVGYAG